MNQDEFDDIVLHDNDKYKPLTTSQEKNFRLVFKDTLYGITNPSKVIDNIDMLDNYLQQYLE